MGRDKLTGMLHFIGDIWVCKTMVEEATNEVIIGIEALKWYPVAAASFKPQVREYKQNEPQEGQCYQRDQLHTCIASNKNPKGAVGFNTREELHKAEIFDGEYEGQKFLSVGHQRDIWTSDKEIIHTNKECQKGVSSRAEE